MVTSLLLNASTAIPGVYETDSGATYYVWSNGWVREAPDGGRRSFVEGPTLLLHGHLYIADSDGQLVANSTKVLRFFEV